MAAGAVGGLIGSAISSAVSAKIAKDNRNWQKMMSDTSYQRGMRDMKKAGLNPILAYKTGGASSPAGSISTVNDPTNSVVSAMHAFNQNKLIKEQAATAKQNRVTAKPGLEYKELKDKIKLKVLSTGVNSARSLRKTLKITPEPARSMYGYGQRAYDWWKAGKKGHPKP